MSKIPGRQRAYDALSNNKMAKCSKWMLGTALGARLMAPVRAPMSCATPSGSKFSSHRQSPSMQSTHKNIYKFQANKNKWNKNNPTSSNMKYPQTIQTPIQSTSVQKNNTNGTGWAGKKVQIHHLKHPKWYYRENLGKPVRCAPSSKSYTIH